jgi:glycosyltransferase involved in cell wall biosynthesis
MKFSIICLTYNRPELLEESIYSVLQQTHLDYELIVINDCSKQTLIYDHPKVVIHNIKQKATTIGSKRNFGKNLATGDYIIQLDDDDLFLPNYLYDLSTILETRDYICTQRPIIYYEDISKIYLSPIPLTNTFVYKRNSIGLKFNYPDKNYDELTPFYEQVLRKSVGFKCLFYRLPPQKCGYVYRQDLTVNRKYAMSKFKTEDINTQNTILDNMDISSGTITLFPKWQKDYTFIIKNNLKIVSRPPPQLYNFKLHQIVEETKTLKEIKKTTIQNKKNNNWKSVKFSWENAKKFIKSAKSRGMVSTLTDVVGLKSTLGERVSEEIYNKRQLSCFGNKNDNIHPCEMLKIGSDGNHYCGSCGCGQQELAKLDSENDSEYTKLHYPYLECPLQKPGFSNEHSPILSVIITSLNEKLETIQKTIETIRFGASDIEIILIDDASDEIVNLNDSNIIFHRNENRIGCAPSRTKGASLARGKYLLFTDAHMIYHPDWFKHFLEYVKDSPENICFCGTCLGLDSERKTLEEARGKYCGARLSLYEKSENQVLEGKWISEKSGDLYELSCLMGAIYIIDRKYFEKLRGLSELKMWGSDEPCLSLKILQSGGKILMAKNIEAGHFFRSKAPYSTNISYLVYNKIRMAKTLLPEKLGNDLINKLNKDGNFNAAMTLIEKHEEEIKEYKKYYDSIFNVNIESICQKYNIQMEM